jgi:hypothetical protein
LFETANDAHFAGGLQVRKERQPLDVGPYGWVSTFGPSISISVKEEHFFRTNLTVSMAGCGLANYGGRLAFERKERKTPVLPL